MHWMVLVLGKRKSLMDIKECSYSRTNSVLKIHHLYHFAVTTYDTSTIPRYESTGHNIACAETHVLLLPGENMMARALIAGERNLPNSRTPYPLGHRLACREHDVPRHLSNPLRLPSHASFPQLVFQIWPEKCSD